MDNKSIFRIKKQENRFTQLHNNVINDVNLSYECLGFLLRCFSLPDSWDFNLVYFLNKFNFCGRDKLQKMIKSLIELGYCKKTLERNERGHFTHAIYTFHEVPQKEQKEASNIDNQCTLSSNWKPVNGKTSAINTNSTNTNFNNTDSTKSILSKNLIVEKKEAQSLQKNDLIELSATSKNSCTDDEKMNSEKKENKMRFNLNNILSTLELQSNETIKIDTDTEKFENKVRENENTYKDTREKKSAKEGALNESTNRSNSHNKGSVPTQTTDITELEVCYNLLKSISFGGSYKDKIVSKNEQKKNILNYLQKKDLKRVQQIIEVGQKLGITSLSGYLYKNYDNTNLKLNTNDSSNSIDRINSELSDLNKYFKLPRTGQNNRYEIVKFIRNKCNHYNEYSKNKMKFLQQSENNMNSDIIPKNIKNSYQNFVENFEQNISLFVHELLSITTIEAIEDIFEREQCGNDFNNVRKVFTEFKKNPQHSNSKVIDLAPKVNFMNIIKGMTKQL